MIVLILHIFHSLLTCSGIPSDKDKYLSMLVAMAIYGPYGGYLCYLRWLSMLLTMAIYGTFEKFLFMTDDRHDTCFL